MGDLSDEQVISDMTHMVKEIVILALEDEYRHLSEHEHKTIVEQKTIDILVKLSQRWS